MQCQMCNNPATVHLTEIINGEKIERHLCDKCAQTEGVTIKAQLPLSDLLNTLADNQENVKSSADLSCPKCQITWTEFRKAGLLSCPNDYNAFAEPLARLIAKAQNNAERHVGKVPKNVTGHTAQPDNHLKLLKLRQDLKEAVEKEDYETAARLRDQIEQVK